MPLRLWIDLQKCAQLIRERGRGNRLRQDANARTTQILLHGQRTLHVAHKCGPGIHIAQMRDGLRAIRIVHAKNRRLREDIGAAQTCRMFIVALNFCRTSEMAFDQHRTGVAT